MVFPNFYFKPPDRRVLRSPQIFRLATSLALLVWNWTWRQRFGFIASVIGGWLTYGYFNSVFALTSRGSGFADALFNPPVLFLALLSTLSMTFGGLLTIGQVRYGGTVTLIGGTLFLAIGGLMAAAGAMSSLWMDEVMIGLAVIAVSVLILTLRRA